MATQIPTAGDGVHHDPDARSPTSLASDESSTVPTPRELVGKYFEWRAPAGGQGPTLRLPSGRVVASFPADVTGYAGIALQMLSVMFPPRTAAVHQQEAFLACGVITTPLISRALCPLAFNGLPSLLAPAANGETSRLNVDAVSQWLQTFAAAHKGGLTSDYPPRYTIMTAFKSTMSAATFAGNSITFPVWPRPHAVTLNVSNDQVTYSTTVGPRRMPGPSAPGTRRQRLAPENLESAPLNILNAAIPPCFDGRPAVQLPGGICSATAWELHAQFRREVYEKLDRLAIDYPEWMMPVPKQDWEKDSKLWNGYVEPTGPTLSQMPTAAVVDWLQQALGLSPARGKVAPVQPTLGGLVSEEFPRAAGAPSTRQGSLLNFG